MFLSMHKYFPGLIIAVAIITLFACGNKDDESCHGCGIDTTVKEYSFPVIGRILEDCSGKPASNKTIELKLYYKEDSLLTVGQTDSTGHFSLTYKLLLPGDYAFSSKWESYCLLHVVEDSVTFFLSGLTQHPRLDLQVGDSLDLNFIVEYVHHPLRDIDTIYYRFEPGIMAGSTYTYKIGGPLSDHALINTIKDKWRFVELDDNDLPVLKYYIKIVRGDGSSGSYGYIPSGTKAQCIMSHQDIIILLN